MIEDLKSGEFGKKVVRSFGFNPKELETFPESIRRKELENKFKNAPAQLPDFLNKFAQGQRTTQNNISPSITNNNRFDINVPPGTPFEQSNAIVESVKVALDTLWYEKMREVFNNNPQVE